MLFFKTNYSWDISSFLKVQINEIIVTSYMNERNVAKLLSTTTFSKEVRTKKKDSKYTAIKWSAGYNYAGKLYGR